MYDTSVFIFRRDLRIHDNTGLIAAQRQSKRVIPIFIFTPTQIDPDQNPFRGNNAVQFMLESLVDLNHQIRERGGRIFVFHKNPADALQALWDDHQFDAVFTNTDYTPYAKTRDEKLAQWCQEKNIDWNSYPDTLLHEPGSITTGSGGPYHVFTPFARNAMGKTITQPAKNELNNFYTGTIASADSTESFEQVLPKSDYNDAIWQHGGRTAGKERLKHSLTLSDYKTSRDIPSLDGTSGMSAYLKFGCLSARECFWYWKNNLPAASANGLNNELYWRDFYSHLGHFYPHVYGQDYNPKYDNVQWSRDPDVFQKWADGQTGFPIVDAGMRQLNTIGWMHNRLRMITASFLTKDLLIDWRLGERYFAQKLIDYDPASNNGGWQWSASTGCDAQPYFRIFNPWRQQERFDPQALYIKQWVPELESLEPKVIHRLGEEKYNIWRPENYPAPMVDHKTASTKTKEVFKAAAARHDA